MNFSNRTSWHRQPNQLAELLEARRRNGGPIFDLTISNPTQCGIEYPQKEILAALSNPEVLHYQPDPQGLRSAREAVAGYYRDKNIIVDPSHVFLTASTSETYSLLFKLLCNAGDSILIPQPSYPLFDYLAQVNDVKLQHYRLRYSDEWHIDIESLKDCDTDSLKTIVVVNPHNPTGMFVKKDEYEHLKDFAHIHNLALIVDEVFIDYPFFDNALRNCSSADETGGLTFTLGGLSKMCGLPQMKLGWTVVSGESSLVGEACERMDILCDTFLSVNTLTQVSLPELITIGKQVREQIQNRVRNNYTILKNLAGALCSQLSIEGGWYGIIRVPRVKSDEEWALQLLKTKGVYLYPGYFFDLDDGHLVVSLLVESSVFQKAIGDITRCVSAGCIEIQA